MCKDICNRESLGNSISWAIAYPGHELTHYVGYEEPFYILVAATDGRLNLYDEDYRIMESIDYTDVSVENLTNLFAAQIDIWLEKKCAKKTPEAKKEEPNSDVFNLKTQIMELQKENQKLKTKHERASKRIFELRRENGELESKIKRLDERNTYITHNYGQERESVEKLKKQCGELMEENEGLKKALNNVRTALECMNQAYVNKD